MFYVYGKDNNMSLDEVNLFVGILLSVLSFLLAAISVITVIITLKQNGKMLQLSNDQINEMRKEHELSLQPVLSFSSTKFVIEKPRLFYTPPEDDYSIISRFKIETEVNNVSPAVAVNIVFSATGFLNTEKGLCQGDTISKRIDYISDKTESLDFLLVERQNGVVFNGLREGNVKMLPQAELKVVFRNTVGGTFMIRKRYIIYPEPEELKEIRRWHSIVASADADYKEIINRLHHNAQKTDALFNQLKETINQRGGEKEKIVLKSVELEEFFKYSSISEEEYNDVVRNAHFGKFIGQYQTECLIKSK